MAAPARSLSPHALGDLIDRGDYRAFAESYVETRLGELTSHGYSGPSYPAVSAFARRILMRPALRLSESAQMEVALQDLRRMTMRATHLVAAKNVLAQQLIAQGTVQHKYELATAEYRAKTAAEECKRVAAECAAQRDLAKTEKFIRRAAAVESSRDQELAQAEHEAKMMEQAAKREQHAAEIRRSQNPKDQRRAQAKSKVTVALEQQAQRDRILEKFEQRLQRRLKDVERKHGEDSEVYRQTLIEYDYLRNELLGERQ